MTIIGAVIEDLDPAVGVLAQKPRSDLHAEPDHFSLDIHR